MFQKLISKIEILLNKINTGDESRVYGYDSQTDKIIAANELKFATTEKRATKKVKKMLIFSIL